MITSPAAIAATTFVGLYAAHMVADHWIQRPRDAAEKGEPGWTGRAACLRHVASYTATCLGTTLAAAFALGYLTQLHPAAVAAATVLNAVTHYIADRREPLRKIAYAVGQQGMWHYGDPAKTLGTGRYALDQSWHIAWLAICAVLTTVGTATA